MNGKRISVVLVIFLFISGMVGASIYAAVKGELYLMIERQKLTKRAGIPCAVSDDSKCNRNFTCKNGDVARGIILNLKEEEGKTSPGGFGLVCANPNELYKTYDIGAIGENFEGKVFRELCDIGFYLAGANFSTNDEKTISGVQVVCRRYWPVEQREGVNNFGGGLEAEPTVCDDGEFVTGIKTDFWRKINDNTIETGLYSLRFYCAQMREYRSLPDQDNDPRDK